MCGVRLQGGPLNNQLLVKLRYYYYYAITRSPRLCDGQGLPDDRHDLPDGPHRRTELAQRLEQRHLVNVLQCSSPLKQI